MVRVRVKVKLYLIRWPRVWYHSVDFDVGCKTIFRGRPLLYQVRCTVTLSLALDLALTSALILTLYLTLTLTLDLGLDLTFTAVDDSLDEDNETNKKNERRNGDFIWAFLEIIALQYPVRHYSLLLLFSYENSDYSLTNLLRSASKFLIIAQSHAC